MISELMELARTDNNKSTINKAKTNINNLAKDVIPPYQEMANMQNKKMQLNVNCNKEINIDKMQLSN